MYQIRCDGAVIYDPRDDDLVLTSPKCKVEVNTVGEASFTIYKDHPHYSRIRKLRSIIEILQDGDPIFRGRVTEDTLDFNNIKDVDVEGVLAFLNDSVVTPFTFPGDFAENADYIAAANGGNVVEFFLGWLLDQHNAQVSDFQRLKLGRVTVADPNNYLSRSSSEYAKTWDTIKGKLFDSALGGYLCIRYEEDGNYIDYLADFELTNTQRIAFGENLLDLTNESDATETYTAVLPLGAQSGESAETQERLTIGELDDGDFTEDIVKSGVMMYSKKAIAEYGFICAPLDLTTWDDVTLATNLRRKAAEYLASEAMKLLNTLTIKAIDLHFTDEQIAALRIYRYTEIESAPHDQQGRYVLTKIDIDIENPQNTVFTFGDKTLTLTDKNSNDKQNIANRVESMTQQAAEQSVDIVELHNTIMEQTTAATQNCEEIILAALQSYVETSNYEEYKETVAAQLQLLADQLALKFSEVTEEIANVDGDLQMKYNQITKFFRFDIDGMTIGQTDSPYKIVLDNDRYSMFVNDLEVLWISAEDGEVHTPELTVTRKINLFGYLIDEDADGTVNCEYVGVSE